MYPHGISLTYFLGPFFRSTNGLVVHWVATLNRVHASGDQRRLQHSLTRQPNKTNESTFM